MAQGDAVNLNGVVWGGTGTTQELQPSSGVEWCITTWWSGSNMEVQHKRSSGTDWGASGDSSTYRMQTVQGGSGSITYQTTYLGTQGRHFFTNTYYPRLRNNGTNLAYAISGIQSK